MNGISEEVVDKLPTTSSSSQKVAIDFETASDVDIRKTGAWRYSEDPSTHILCLAYKLPRKPIRIWRPLLDEPFPQDLIDAIENGIVVEAHNAQFEQAIWRNVLMRDYDVPWPKRWADTLATCAYRAVPQALDDVGVALNLHNKKDRSGKDLIRKLCQPQKWLKKERLEWGEKGYDPEKPELMPKKWIRDPDLLQALYDYCEQDVATECDVAQALGDLPPVEQHIWVMDQRINTRGVRVDLDLIGNIQAVYDSYREELAYELVRITEGFVQKYTEVAKIKEFCTSKGYPISDTRADTVSAAIEDIRKLIKDGLFDKDEVMPILRTLIIRSELSKSSIAKLKKAIDSVCGDGYLRGLLQYHGAGTGRWAGRMVQPQNFPRGSLEFYCEKFGLSAEDMMEKLVRDIWYAKTFGIDYLASQYGDPTEPLVTALRGIFIASEGCVLRVADFSAIEAVVLAWVAREEWKVKAFKEIAKGNKFEGNDDIYCATASKIFQRKVSKKENKTERQVGKTCELAFGYQGGLGAWRAFDSSDTYSDEEVHSFKDGWRQQHPMIKQFWYEIENAAVQTVRTQESYGYLNIRFEYVTDNAGPWLTCVLPNGKRLWYYKPELRQETRWVFDPITETNQPKQSTKLSYMSRDNKRAGAWGRVDAYGGLLTENIVQALAREIMVLGMMRVEAAGYKIILTVHDEIISDCNKDHGSQEEFESLMAGPNPDWLTDCPVAVDGWFGTRYRKG